MANIPTTVIACVLGVMQPSVDIPPVAISHETSKCPPWHLNSERSCYAFGTIYTTPNMEPSILAHEYAHHVQLFTGKVKFPIDDEQRRRLEAEAVNAQIQCGR